jgi:uncharacterized paraquat-inducible protein A
MNWREWLKNPRKWQMATCPKCKRRHRLPLSADPAKAECSRCFERWAEKAAAELDRAMGRL